jgi:hypothetical protein
VAAIRDAVLHECTIRQRPEWVACRDRLPATFETYHRNDQPDLVRAAADGQAPVVVAVTDEGRHVLLLTLEALDACQGSIEPLITAIEDALGRLGLAD